MRLNERTLLPQFCRDPSEPAKSPSRVRERWLREDLCARASCSLQDWRQAVRSLGPLRCTCYQASTRGLATSSSRWDLDWVRAPSGTLHLGGGFALRCFQRLSILDVAIQLWPRQANWLTSGPAISVLSYWR